MNDWTQVMDAVRARAEELELPWFRVRSIAIDTTVAQDPEFYEGHGIGSSDGNHMIYGMWLAGELEPLMVEQAETEKFRRELDAQGVDWSKLAELLA